MKHYLGARVDVSWNRISREHSIKGVKKSDTIIPMFKRIPQTDKVTSGHTRNYKFFTNNYELLQAKHIISYLNF